MPERLIQIYTPIKARWDILTRRQQIQLISVVAVLLLALVLILFFAFRTSWVVLYNNRDFTEISQVSSALDEAGIRNRPSSCYSRIYVPARNRIDAHGVALRSANVAATLPLEDAISLTGLGTTEAERAAILLGAAQSDVANMLTGIDFITRAQVNITPAERNLMLRPNQPQASMGVTIHTTRHVSPTEGRLLAEMVRTMVLGLELENIVIMDQHGNGVFVGNMVPESDSAMDVWNMRNRQEQRTTDSIETALLNTFDDLTILHHFAYEDRIDEEVRITVRTAPDGTEDGLPTFLQTSQQEAEGMLGWNWGPGLGANQQATPAYMMGDPSLARASARDRTVSFEHNIYDRITRVGPGGMIPEASNIAVIAVRDIIVCESTFFQRNGEATQEDWWYIEENTPRSVNIVEGDEVEEIRMVIAAGTGIPLANVGVMIQERFIIIPVEDTPLPIATIIMLAVLLLLILMLIIALLARRKEDEEDEVEPELSVEDLLATTQLEEAKEEASRLEEIDYEKENEVKKQIDKFVNEKPEAVAALLRNWLNAEEW
ncbi:MAG: hypothetical protein FWB88_12580 [Defluviitaleaceae bacterium]|nr:hypothetical protein [Defluviitaleaceae bacterium]MCL2240433.1 hypothetical protein [Defluviitaleaceae bacterium]